MTMSRQITPVASAALAYSPARPTLIPASVPDPSETFAAIPATSRYNPATNAVSLEDPLGRTIKRATVRSASM